MTTAQEVGARVISAIRAGAVVMPGIPTIAQKVREAVDDPDNDISEVAKLIQTDVAMTARLVQIANSPMYRGITPVASCRAAVNRLGLAVTRNLVMVFALRRVFSTTEKTLLQNMEQLWAHCAQVAAVSSVLARLTPGLDSERAMLAGLVHDAGMIPLLDYLHKQKMLNDNDLSDLIAGARAEVTREVLNAWRFDDMLIEAAVAAEDYARDNPAAPNYTDVVAAAHWKLFGGSPGAELPPVARKFSLFTLGEDAGKELLSDAQRQIDDVVAALK